VAGARYKGNKKAAHDAVVLVNAAADKIIRARMEVEDHCYTPNAALRLADETMQKLAELRAVLELKRDGQ